MFTSPICSNLVLVVCRTVRASHWNASGLDSCNETSKDYTAVQSAEFTENHTDLDFTALESETKLQSPHKLLSAAVAPRLEVRTSKYFKREDITVCSNHCAVRLIGRNVAPHSPSKISNYQVHSFQVIQMCQLSASSPTNSPTPQRLSTGRRRGRLWSRDSPSAHGPSVFVRNSHRGGGGEQAENEQRKLSTTPQSCQYRVPTSSNPVALSGSRADRTRSS